MRKSFWRRSCYSKFFEIPSQATDINNHILGRRAWDIIVSPAIIIRAVNLILSVKFIGPGI
jgi:hypothetical protein